VKRAVHKLIYHALLMPRSCLDIDRQVDAVAPLNRDIDAQRIERELDGVSEVSASSMELEQRDLATAHLYFPLLMTMPKIAHSSMPCVS